MLSKSNKLIVSVQINHHFFKCGSRGIFIKRFDDFQHYGDFKLLIKLYFLKILVKHINYNISFTSNLLENEILSHSNNAFELAPYSTGSYSNFTLTDENNCKSTYSIPVEIGVMIDTCPSIPIKVPNVFTANGDGYNEKFEVFGLADYSFTQVYIYNRWGSLVYSSPNYAQKPWDGGNYPESVYYYLIEYGSSEKDKKAHHGVVHLLR